MTSNVKNIKKANYIKFFNITSHQVNAICNHNKVP